MKLCFLKIAQPICLRHYKLQFSKFLSKSLKPILITSEFWVLIFGNYPQFLVIKNIKQNETRYVSNMPTYHILLKLIHSFELWKTAEITDRRLKTDIRHTISSKNHGFGYETLKFIFPWKLKIGLFYLSLIFLYLYYVKYKVKIYFKIPSPQ